MDYSMSLVMKDLSLYFFLIKNVIGSFKSFCFELYMLVIDIF